MILKVLGDVALSFPKPLAIGMGFPVGVWLGGRAKEMHVAGHS